MKKILLTLLALLFAISFLPSVGTRDAIDSQTMQQEQLKQPLSSKIRYFYNSAIEGSSIMTTNNREFHDNVSDSDQVIVVFELNNKPEFLNERLHNQKILSEQTVNIDSVLSYNLSKIQQMRYYVKTLH